MMSPFRFHDPPIAGAASSHSVCAAPPAMFSFLSAPPASKAMNLLSGDQKNGGACAAISEPLERPHFERIHRPHVQTDAAIVAHRQKGEMAPVWREADVARRGEIHGVWNLESNRVAGLRTLAEVRESHRSEGHEQHRGRRPRQPRSFRRAHLGRAVEQQIQVADVAQSLLRIFLETALDQWPHPRRDGVPRRLGCQDRGDRVAGGGAVKRTAATHHFIDASRRRPRCRCACRRPWPRACSGDM